MKLEWLQDLVVRMLSRPARARGLKLESSENLSRGKGRAPRGRVD